MHTSIPILVNSRAGAFHSTASVDQLRQMAEKTGVQADVIGTGSSQEMREVARRLVSAGAPRIAVAGGDGTVRSVVQELVHTDTALGILQQGTFNNFATALGLPRDIPSALRVLRDGRILEVSVGRAGDYYFTEPAGVGLFADGLALYGNESNKNVWRGLKAMISVLVRYRPYHLRLTLDGHVLEERAIMCTAANTFRMAQAVPIAPHARLTDEHLDIVILGDLTRAELLPYLRAVRAQTHQGLPKVRIYQAQRLRVETKTPRHVHVDDESIATTPVDISIQPRALKVLVDRS